ncbi:hypothetical protein BDA96_08G079200 [Sorghum bicolor]|uniref:Uncharacterized protein n=1 Tax=Sorghum bicolor TaxID=4558 RepID=A0A921QE24_SORBI|nr:hypothetical protein BDA96_08G079200 [Sorghum bicolor]
MAIFLLGLPKCCPNQRGSSIGLMALLRRFCMPCYPLAHVPNVSPRPILGLSTQTPSIARTVITQDTPIELSIPTSFSIPFHGMTQSWLSNFSSCRSGCFTNYGGQKITRDTLLRLPLLSFVGLRPSVSWRWSSMTKHWRVH